MKHRVLSSIRSPDVWPYASGEPWTYWRNTYNNT